MLLYQYCKRDGIDILENKRFKLSNISRLNDPFEFRLSFDDRITFEIALENMNNDDRAFRFLHNIYLTSRLYTPRSDFRLGASQINQEEKDHFKRWFRSMGKVTSILSILQDNYNNLMESVLGDLFDYQNNTFRIVCLTACPDSLLMWSHYGEQHHGILAGFDSDKFPITDPLELIKVDYSDDRILLPASLIKPKLDEATLNFAKTKHTGWAYEEEYRLLFEKENHDYVPIPPESVKEVILGMRCDEETTLRVRKALTTPDFNHVVLKKAKMHPTKFALIYDTIQARDNE